MKILLVYASAGMGHKAAAEALFDFFKKKYPGLEVEIRDILTMCSPRFAALYSRGYYRLARSFPFGWEMLYRITQFFPLARLVHFISRQHCAGFIEYLRTLQPEVVVATHFFPAEVVTFLNRKGFLLSRLVSVITDFGVHPLWVLKDCDTYIVASESTRTKLTVKNRALSKIKVFGIPVHSDFLTVAPTHNGELRALLVTGSFGLASSEKIVDALASQILLTVVCGRNEQLYERLKNKSYPSVKVLGFTDQMARLMSEADLVITKPGGLGIAEALVQELPMIFINGIPGQETENARILEEYGCAIISRNLAHLKSIIVDFKRRPQNLAECKARIRMCRKPKATEEICAYVCASGSRAAG